jgi:ectoine hydroxylase-related dioxygenase (phytanoyl-CoA dioxygenase family)
MYPNLISAFVALDESTLENGCLRVLKGSHLMGRMDHGKVGTQTGVEPKRLNLAESLLEQVPCVMKPGSVLFFHSNLLHASSANDSDNHRRAFIICYNAVSNPQMKTSGPLLRPSCPVGAEGDILKF